VKIKKLKLGLPQIQSQAEPLLRIQKAIDVFLEKSRRGELNLRNHKKLIRENKGKVAKAYNEWLDYLVKNRSKTLKGIKPKTITENLIDWDDIRKKGEGFFRPVLHGILNEAGKAVVERKVLKQDRFDPLGEGAVEWVKKHSAELVVEITEETMKGIKSYVKWGINEGKSIYHIGRELRPIVGLTERLSGAVAKKRMMLMRDPKLTVGEIDKKVERYAKHLQKYRTERIAKTETAKALSEGELQGYDQMGVKEVKFNADPEACDICAAKDGEVYSLEDAQGIIPVHPNCLPGDSLVSPRGRISGMSKRWYEGKIIIFKTASGNILSSTPQHPVLTVSGFVPSSSLNVGDYVVSYRGSKRPSFGSNNYQERPARIEDIFSSFLKSSSVMAYKVPVSPKDFHSDGVGSKIAIIASNRFLMNSSKSSFFKHPFKFNLFIRKIRRLFFDSSSMLALSLPGYGSTSSGLLGFGDLPFSLFGTHLLPLENSSFTVGSDMNFSVHKSLSNYSSGNSMFFRKSQLRNARLVKFYNFFSREFVTFVSALTVPGAFFDRVAHVEASFYKGFIYNLETSKSYYIANNIATHNCECTWTAVT